MKPYQHLPDQVRRHIVKTARQNFWARVNSEWKLTPDQRRDVDEALHDAAIIAATEAWNMKERGS